MQTNKKQLAAQRRLIEKKIHPWTALRSDRPPPSGWLKAIRGALGLSSRQLADLLGVKQPAVLQFEKSEAQHKISLETLEKAAKAMKCQLVYAIVPMAPFSSLENVLDDQAIKSASLLVSRVDQTMKLEQQGIPQKNLNEQTRELAKELKRKMSPGLWRPQSGIPKGKKSDGKP